MVSAGGFAVVLAIGVTLGGAEIGADGSWTGNWKAVPSINKGSVSITVPSASAVIVKMTAN